MQRFKKKVCFGAEVAICQFQVQQIDQFQYLLVLVGVKAWWITVRQFCVTFPVFRKHEMSSYRCYALLSSRLQSAALP